MIGFVNSDFRLGLAACTCLHIIDAKEAQHLYRCHRVFLRQYYGCKISQGDPNYSNTSSPFASILA